MTIRKRSGILPIRVFEELPMFRRLPDDRLKSSLIMHRKACAIMNTMNQAIMGGEFANRLYHAALAEQTSCVLET